MESEAVRLLREIVEAEERFTLESGVVLTDPVALAVARARVFLGGSCAAYCVLPLGHPGEHKEA